jgi:uncharacterized membrane protein YdjX (TVP38/TMEM64 family)
MRYAKAAAAIAAAAALLAAGRYFPVPDHLRGALDGLAASGAAGAALFVGLYVLACVLFVPGSVLTLGAGAVFGVLKGSVLVSVGATLGATAAFLVGRYAARGWVSAKMAGRPKFKAVDEAVAAEGWKIVGLVRLSPVFPFTLMNYAFGVTRVSLRDYFFASWLGMLPGTVMYVYIGSLAGQAAAGRAKTPAEWALTAVGLAATVAVTVYITRLARRALSGRVPDA